MISDREFKIFGAAILALAVAVIIAQIVGAHK